MKLCFEKIKKKKNTLPPKKKNLNNNKTKQNNHINSYKVQVKNTNLIFIAGKQLHHLYHKLDVQEGWTQSHQQQYSKILGQVKPHMSYGWQNHTGLNESAFSVNSENLCTECGTRFLNPKSFQEHMADFHQKLMPFVCSLCGKCYGSAGGLQHHTRLHDGKIYVCPVCDSTFSQSGTMNRHLRTVHNTGQCSVCRGIFKLGDDYNQHVLHCKPLVHKV